LDLKSRLAVWAHGSDGAPFAAAVPLARAACPCLPGRRSVRPRGRSSAALIVSLLIGVSCSPGKVAAETAAISQSSVGVPSFWDPRRRPERPDLSHITSIRFLTEIDYPPFDFPGADGNPAGFNVDIARMICEDLKVNCTIQMRRFDTLIAALGDNHGDAVIASLAPTAALRQRVDFSDPYYRSPARFVVRRDAAITDVRPERLEGRKIAVTAGTAHEAYIRTFFTQAELKAYPTAEAARDAVRNGEADLLFADAIGLAFWLNGTDSANCCRFVGAAFTESRYFGEGIGIAVKKGNDTLRQVFNWSLFRLWEQGHYTDLWLRYFPISPF
jgi:polar amino acid transport system substrate-binding protein